MSNIEITPGAVRGAIRYCLRRVAKECEDRCLFKAATWSLEQLMSIDPPPSSSGIESNIDSNQLEILHQQETNAFTSGYYEKFVKDTKHNQHPDVVRLARTMIINGEYQRCHYLLSKHYSIRHIDGIMMNQDTIEDDYQLAIFLNLYSAYISGEKLKNQLQAEKSGPGGSMNRSNRHEEKKKSDVSDKKGKKNNTDDADKEGPTTATERALIVKNSKLRELIRQLFYLYFCHTEGHDHNNMKPFKMDGYLLYLFAVVLRDINRQDGIPIDLLMYQLNQTYQAECKKLHSNNKETRDILNLTPRMLFIESIQSNPWNWSCWLEFANLIVAEKQSIPSWNELSAISDSSLMDVSHSSTNIGIGQQLEYEAAKLMYGCFLTHVYLEQHCGDQALQVIESIAPMLPHSMHIITSLGLAQYTQRNYDDAEISFEQVRDEDPYRLQAVDTYSNILYVKEKQAKLSSLAHTVVEIEKFCPESCCVVGNYYSLKGQHERAVLYFQRALRLNPRYLSAWTLMGHEYMELRNAAAAVQCYRNAVSISENDYRAWYGLGQTYEMLHLYQYSQYYFRKAAYLRPHDARMWSAVGNCQLKLGMKAEAIVTFERAVNCGDNEGIATRNLARLCREEGQAARAAEFYMKYLEAHANNSEVVGPELDGENQSKDVASMQSSDAVKRVTMFANITTGPIDSEQAEALLFLATYYASTGNLSIADGLCNRLLGFIGPEGDEARAMLRDIRMNKLQTGTETSTSASVKNHLTSPLAINSRDNDAPTNIPTPSESLHLDYTSLSISSASNRNRSSDAFRSSGHGNFALDDSQLPSFDTSNIHSNLEVRGVSISSSPSNVNGSPGDSRRRTRRQGGNGRLPEGNGR